MRKYLLAAAAAAAVATPAAARDNSFYAGVDAGALFAKDRNLHIDSKNSYYFGYYLNLYTGSYTADVRTDYKTGYDVDAVAGYDFGIFRLEGELGYKHASHDHYAPVGTLADAVGDVEVPADGKTTVLSGMINGLLDFGINDGLSFSVGGGAGIAKTKYRFAFPATDTFFDNLRTSVKGTKFAWQVIAAARYAISPNIDVGLKYRYFDGGHIHDH